MSLCQLNNFGACPSFSSASSIHGGEAGAKPKIMPLRLEETKDRIRKMFDKAELSVSSYDTAWVAMAPSPTSPGAPLFPQCVDWLMENQASDGSWSSVADSKSLLMKDTLSSTLACVLALKRWDVGQDRMNKGLKFIEKNFASATDPQQLSPLGFNIVFPGMIEMAQNLGLNFSMGDANFDALIQERAMELRRGFESESRGRRAYLAYVYEGIGKLQNWEMVTKHQRKNGSLFNSPSATAAAFTRTKDDGCLNYLLSLLSKFGNSVPTIYPLDVNARLCMVDELQRLGIDRYFSNEIKSVLDEAYGLWMQGEEDIFLNVTTCVMAFRLLRVNGYNVSSDVFAQFSEEDKLSDSIGGYLDKVGSALELFKASQIMLYSNEHVLKKVNSWTGNFLNCPLLKDTTRSDGLQNNNEEVKYALKYTYNAALERMSTRKAIEHYNIDSTKISKTWCSNLYAEDFLKLAVEDFNMCQDIHRKELQDLARWVVEKRLDKLKFARQKLEYCYFSAFATIFSPELSAARLAWTKSSVLTTVIDDFFEVGGSEKEIVNFIQVVERWYISSSVDYYCSETVEIIFSALHDTVCEISTAASTWQGRDVTSHIIDIWSELLRCARKEYKWTRDKVVPPMDDYMSINCVGFALGPIILPTLYLVGPKLSEEVVGNAEYNNLLKMTSICGRLLNDIQSFERESRAGKLNAVSLLVLNGGDTGTEAEAIEAIRVSINEARRELLRLVLAEEGSTIPRACKDLFWKMSQVLHLFYMNGDGFTTEEKMKDAKELIGQAIVLNLQKFKTCREYDHV